MTKAKHKQKQKNNITEYFFLPLLAVAALFVFILFGNDTGTVNSSSLAPLQWQSSKTQEIGPTLFGPYPVKRVVDGDTVVIEIDGKETNVRLVGIDTPESVNFDKAKNTPEGTVASDFTKELLEGKEVYLEYDIDQFDDYSRTLAYVYLDDKTTMVQDKLIEAGMATVMTIQPNSKYADRFYDLQTKARENLTGFWRTGFFGG